jgi:hypothetical protein
MSRNNDLLKAIISEDYHTANKLINESLLYKLGDALEEKLTDFAPTVFNEGKLTPKQKKHIDKNNNDKIDAQDFKLLRKESADPEMEAILENFETELLSLIEEVQEELGEELSENEIIELANEYLSMMEDNATMDAEEYEDTEGEVEEDEEEDELDAGNQAPNIRQSGVEY